MGYVGLVRLPVDDDISTTVNGASMKLYIRLPT
jgi:hypothetical protein